MPYDLILTDTDVKTKLNNVIEECKPNKPKYRHNKVIGYRERLPKHELQARLCVYRDLNLIDENVFRYYWNLLNYEYERNVTKDDR